MELDLADVIRDATTGVFATMLGTDLAVEASFEDNNPFLDSEVTGFVSMAGEVVGYVSVHCTRQQATDFTARLIGGDLDEIDDDEDVRDAVGEIANMLAGNVKTALAQKGAIEIALPTVCINPSADLKVRGATGLVVPFEDYTGPFYVEVVLASGPISGP